MDTNTSLHCKMTSGEYETILHERFLLHHVSYPHCLRALGTALPSYPHMLQIYLSSPSFLLI